MLKHKMQATAKIKKSSLEDEYKEKLLAKFADMPYDVFHSLLFAFEDYIHDKPETFKNHLCPKCLFPYRGGFFKARIVPFPRKKSVIKTLLMREACKRTSRKEKVLLDAFRRRQNIHFIKCKKCGHESFEKFDLPPRPKPQKEKKETKQDKNMSKSKKKRLKRKKKDKKLVEAKLDNLGFQPTVKKFKLKEMQNKEEDNKTKRSIQKRSRLELNLSNQALAKAKTSCLTTKKQISKLKHVLDNTKTPKANTLGSFLGSLI